MSGGGGRVSASGFIAGCAGTAAAQLQLCAGLGYGVVGVGELRLKHTTLLCILGVTMTGTNKQALNST